MMSGSCESNSPFLHVMPVRPDESFSDFQERLLFTLSEGNPLPLPPLSSLAAEETSGQTTELQECLLGSDYIALLTKQGRAGRIRFEATEKSPAPSPLQTDQEWTAQDEALANQLRPQLEAGLSAGRGTAQLMVPHQLLAARLTDYIGLGTATNLGVRIRAPIRISPQPPLSMLQPVATETEIHIPDSKQDSNQLDLKELLRFSEVEWAAGDQLFSTIAVMTSEILLVCKGQLYSWPLEDTRPRLHPRTAGLQLEGEEVVSLSAATLRASVATHSGRAATFYDRSITRHTDCISGSSLIETLSHPLLSVGLPAGDAVASLSVSETASYLLSKAGRVFWWGLVSSGSSPKSPSPRAEAVSVDAFVSLRESCPCPPGGLLLNLATPYCPLLATLAPQAPSGADPVLARLLSGGELVRWRRRDTIFLENKPAVLGRLVAIDKELAVVNISQRPGSLEVSNGYNPGDIKVYPLSKLQPVRAGGEGAEEVPEERGSVSTAQGLVQLEPICLLEPEERRAAPATLTGFRCISLTSHLEGPLLLLERVADNHLFLLNSATATDQQSDPNVFCGSVKHKLNWSNATCEEESIPASISGLLATERYSHSKARFVASAYSNVQILLDANGHVRPIQSFYRLRPPLCPLPAAFECLSLSRVRIGRQEYIGLLCVAKKRGLARAIEDNNLSLVKQLTESYIRNSVTGDITSQVKRPKLSDSSEPGDYVLELSRADLFLEKSCSNRNILHASIRTLEGSPLWSEALCGVETPSCIRWDKSYVKHSFEEIRWKSYSEEKGNASPLTQTETTNAILSYLLSVPALARVVRFLLCERDLSGSTPLMLALRNQDLPTASLILDYVENMPSSADSLRQQAHLYQNAIALPCLENQSPIQTLLFNSAIPHCEFGLKTILIQFPTVASITPRSLLSFIQTRYPSAYRCEAYDMKGAAMRQASMVLSIPFLRQTKINLKSLPDPDTRSMLHSSTPARFLVAFSDVWEMRDAISELNTQSITSANQTGSPYVAFLSVQQYCGQNVFSDKWKREVKKSYSKPSADKLDAEEQSVALVKRLLEVLPSDQQGGQENLLSSILHNKLLIQYLQDMHGLSHPSYKFIFGSKLVYEPVAPVQPSGFLGGLQSVISPQLAEPSEEDAESVPAGEAGAHSQSVLDILASSWSLVASGICQPGTGNDPCYSRRDSLVLSLIIDTPSSVIETVLRSILDRVEKLQTSELIHALGTTDACVKLEEQDACVVTVVKKFLQSLVRLYTSTIEQDKHFEFESSNSDSSVPEARDRIFSVLRSFRTLAVLELFISAQALCWPLITGNLKLYPKNSNFVDPSTHPHYASPAGARAPSVTELCHHSKTQLLAAASPLPTPPQRGLKLPFSEPALAPRSPPRPREKRERSDYWGG